MKQKKSGGIVYSTNPDFVFQQEPDVDEVTLPPQQQQLRVRIESKGRKGKTVTLVEGFSGKEEDLTELGRVIKVKCGTGGAVKDGQIILQGDVRDKVMSFLLERGYKAKKAGG